MKIIKCITCKKEKKENDFGLYAGHIRKNCNQCREWLQDYNKRNRDHLLEIRRFKYHTDPKSKVKEQNKEYSKKTRDNSERYRQLKNNHLKRKYKIDIHEYDRMLELQNNKCAICEIEFTENKSFWNRPCVDHCHQTNKVRGILCRQCNVMLYWYDKPKIKEAAERYLQINGA